MRAATATLALIVAIFGVSARKAAAQCTATGTDAVSWWTGDCDATDLSDGNDGVLENGA